MRHAVAGTVVVRIGGRGTIQKPLWVHSQPYRHILVIGRLLSLHTSDQNNKLNFLTEEAGEAPNTALAVTSQD